MEDHLGNEVTAGVGIFWPKGDGLKYGKVVEVRSGKNKEFLKVEVIEAVYNFEDKKYEVRPKIRNIYNTEFVTVSDLKKFTKPTEQVETWVQNLNKAMKEREAMNA